MLSDSAAEDLVRTEAETRGTEAASAAFQEFQSRLGSTGPVAETVRERLGALALTAGGLPDVPMPLLDGTWLRADSLRGRVTVLDFWATWCGPCHEELPRLRRVEGTTGDRIDVVGINLDRADELTAEHLREWILRQDVTGLQVYDGLSWDSDLVKAFGVKEIPFSVVVAADGTVVAVNPRGRQLNKAVRGALRMSR